MLNPKKPRSTTKKRAWPPSTSIGIPLKTKEAIAEIYNASWFVPDEKVTKAVTTRLNDAGTPLLGVKGKTLFDGYLDFDWVTYIPAEWMHSMLLGCSKMLFELTYKDVGTNRPRIVKHAQANVALFNALITDEQVTSDTSRKTRAMQYGNYKAQEWKMLVTVFFEIVIAPIPAAHLDRAVWKRFAYLMRAYTLPEDEFHGISKKHLKEVARLCYKMWHSLYGSYNCVYNVHMLAHLELIRKAGPFCTASAFPFEGYFAQMTRSFAPGTTSTGTQIMQTTFLKMLTGHKCVTDIKYAIKADNTGKTRDDLVYTFRKEVGKYRYFQIFKVRPTDGHLICKEINAAMNVDGEGPGHTNLNFANVGVHTYGEEMPGFVALNPKDVSGKALHVLDKIISLSHIWLRE